MFFEYLSSLLGLIKLFIYKVMCFNRIVFSSIPVMNSSFKLNIKKGSKLILGRKFRSRYNVSFRIYDGGIVKVGENVFFNDSCSVNCQESIVFGNDIVVGQNVMFFDHDHDYRNDMYEFVRKPIVIGNNVWIGANCVILKGVTIGDNVVIGAGTVVNKDIPSNSVAYQEKKMIIKEK